MHLDNLQLLLKPCGISKKLSDATGISTGNISDWKKGKSKPTAEALVLISDYFNVSIDYLLGRTDYPDFCPENSFVNNGSVSSDVGTIIICDGGEHTLSQECAELVQVYESLNIRQRVQLLRFALELGDSSAETKN